MGNKTLFITGGSRGIGRATALLAAQKGWTQIAFSYHSDQAAADETVKAIEALGAKALALPGNVCEEADVIDWFEQILAGFGSLEGFVNNAGIVAPSLPLTEMSAERMKKVFDTNILGAYLCAREAARAMTDGGSMVNISSIAARLGSPNEYLDYAGSKAAVDTLTVGLAKELAPKGIRVNCVRPGLIRTDIHASGGQPGRAERLGAGTPMGRAGEPEEIAQAILWFLNPESSYATGSILEVSGGR